MVGVRLSSATCTPDLISLTFTFFSQLHVHFPATVFELSIYFT